MPTTAATKLAPEQQEQLMRVFDLMRVFVVFLQCRSGFPTVLCGVPS